MLTIHLNRIRPTLNEQEAEEQIQRIMREASDLWREMEQKRIAAEPWYKHINWRYNTQRQ